MKKMISCFKPPSVQARKYYFLFLISTLFGISKMYASPHYVKANLESNAFSLLLQDTLKIRGKVFGNQEPPLPIKGASIMVKSTGLYYMSDENGNFEVITQMGDSLTVSYVGYSSTSLLVTKDNDLVVNLKEVTSELEQVVVAGYSKQKVKNLASSVAVVNSSNIENKPITQLSQALQGGVTGISVAQGSGLPGGDQAIIKIRGLNTLGYTDPLVLVDGVPFDLNVVDPVTVESVTVLKDAAAASVYGARAANGVILVTTKRGVAGPVKVSYNAYAGVQQPNYIPEFADAPTYMRVSNEANANAGREPQYSQEEIEITQNGSDPLRYPNTDWSKVIIGREAFITNHTISLSGGNSLARFAVTGSYLNQKGIIKNTEYDRFTFRANTSVSLRENITMNLDFNATRGNQLQPYDPQQGAGYNANWVLFQTYGIPPTVVSKFPIREDGVEAYGNYGEMRNPLARLEKGARQSNITDVIQVNFQPTWEIIPKLNFKLQYNYRVGASNVTINGDAYNFVDYFSNQLIYTFNSSTGSSASRNTYNYLSGILDYEKNFDKHRLFSLAGVSQEYDSPNTIDISTLRSAFVKLYYSYDQKYLLEASVRGDGSSRFGPGKKWGVFPSIALGWNISNEEFLVNSEVVSNWKLRATYGTLGNNQNVGPYRYQTTIDPGAGGEQVIGNPNITWETVKMLDIGTDIALFNNKLSFVIDWYDKITDDILLTPPVSQASGLLPTSINAGVVRNRGWEFAVNYNHKLTKDLNVSLRTGLSAYKNTILQLPGGPYYSGSSINMVGEPLNVYYGLMTDGLLQESDIASNIVRSEGAVAGDIKYIDTNGDGLIDNNDRQIIGNPEPRVNYFANLSTQFKSFDFEIQLNGFGQSTAVYSGRIAAPLDLSDPGAKPMLFQLDYWTPQNTDARFPRIVPNGLTSSNVTRFSNYWFENAAYSRVRYIQLGYTLNNKIAKSLKMSSMRVYLNAQNPFTFTKMLFLDPESRGSEQTYPLMKVYTAGISVNF